MMHRYTGPVAGLNDEYILVTSQNVTLTTTRSSVFLKSGSGDDALGVASGNNVLDGSTGSNFLVGGSGNDTFFVDDRAASADIWSTLVNFNAGDSATLWGVSASDFHINWKDNEGAAGYSGLTLHATAAGRATASMTIAGYSSGDLNNGRLSVTYGEVGGSKYMFVHGN